MNNNLSMKYTITKLLFICKNRKDFVFNRKSLRIFMPDFKYLFMQDFIHIHVHSQYSLLDGQASIQALVDKAINNNMKGIALTDHGSMFGIKEFYNYVTKKNGDKNIEIQKLKKQIDSIESQERGNEENELELKDCFDAVKKIEENLFKPILGCEMYVARNRLFDKKGKDDKSGHHLIVLAKNEKGYHNLIKLVSKSWTEGFYYRPRTDRAELEKYHEGLIITTACLAGEVPRKIFADQIEDAGEVILWYKKLFGEDFYLELQRHKATVARANYEAYPMQQKVNAELIKLSQKYGVKLICTNDVHFVDEENAEAHDHLICLSTGKDLDDPDRMVYSKQEWMKTKEEMYAIFSDVPEALSNTLEILDKVEFYSINHEPILPNFPKPEGFLDDNDYLRHLTYKGAEKRWREMSEEQKERIEFELATIKHMGFPGYFLIVQDFIAAARKMSVSVGPGRGSAAGSAVAYCLGITQIDPIKFDLLFERFLNPDRISLPDIDIDFDDDGRGDVLHWVTEKYGAEKVAHIITYGTMATKMAIKDVARVEKLSLSESDRLTKLIPERLPEINGKAQKINLKNCIRNVPELQDACNNSDDKIRNTMKYAQMLEGNVRNTGVHACGTIICRDDITDWVPVSTADDKITGEKMLITQYEGSVIEETGLIKMDFLGLKTLSIIKEAIENIRLRHSITLDIENIDFNDTATYQLYCQGRTVGTFQFESAGMQKYLKELQPSTFEDLIAMNALYRPGPMSYIPQFINRKHGVEKIEYDIPIMEKYLKDTYGITVYQEQVMLLSRLLANFSRGESDTLRKAMGKKLRDKLDHMKPQFIEGGKENGYDPKVLEKIWGDWEKFASYAFNKSHATCYSWVAFQTAYLKANYPSEYMAAVLSRNISDIADISRFMDECKSMGIQVLGPDVNESNKKFTVNKAGNIRFGLCAIKGVGENAVQNILEEREAKGPFTGIFNFIQRVNLSACNKKNVECLALAGGFDNFTELTREQYFAINSKGEPFLDSLIRYGNKFQQDHSFSHNSLFGEDSGIEIATPEIPSTERWPDIERLNKEKELVGIYLSAHPLDQYYMILNYYCNTTLKTFAEDKDSLKDMDIRMGGLVENFREGSSKNGKPYGIVKIEDYSGSSEVALFGKNYIDFGKYMKKGFFLLIQGRMLPHRFKENELDFTISSVQELDSVKDCIIERLTISMPSEAIDDVFINELDVLTDNQKGETMVYFNLVDEETGYRVQLRSDALKINVTRDLIDYLSRNENLAFQIN